MKTTDRHIAILAIGITASLSGCAGGSDTASNTPAPVVQPNGQTALQSKAPSQPKSSGATSKAAPAAAKTKAERKAARARAKHATRKTQSSKGAARTHAGTQKTHKKHITVTDLLERSAKARRSLVAKMAPRILKGLGFPTATATTDPSGRNITVQIPRDAACTARPSDEAAIRKRFGASFKFAREIRVMAAGSQQTLSAYVGANCAPKKLPSAPGGVVLSQSGNGATMTREFTVKSKKWTVVYENQSGYFSAILYKGDQAQPQFVYSQKRESGKATFKGAGTYKLSISASGGWRVEVHD